MEFITNTVGSTIFQSLLVKREDNADDFIIKMLTHNEIEGLLPISVIQKNLDLDVRYNVTSLLPLAQIMQEPLSKNKVMTIVKSIAKVVQNVEEYMLDAQCILLDEKYIYVNIVNAEASFIYLPMANPCAVDVIAFVKRLMTAFQYDSNEDSSYLLKMMNAFNSGSIQTVHDLLDFIEKMERGKVSSSKQTSTAKQPLTSADAEKKNVTPVNPTPVAASVHVENSMPNIPVKQEESVSKPKSGLFGKAMAPKVEKAKPEKVKAEKPKNKLFAGKSDEKVAQAVIPVRIPGESGMTPAFAIPGQAPSTPIPATPTPAVPTPATSISPKSVGEVKDIDISGKPLTAQEESMAQRKMPMPNLMRDYGNTIVMNENNSNVTRMLDDEGSDNGGVLRASITRVGNNQKMYVEKNILKMGKESDYVDFYIGNNQTISRSHADIICEDGKYYVRDNNSKNHTYVNGQQIVPGQLVPIENNTEIKLSNEVFVFQFS